MYISIRLASWNFNFILRLPIILCKSAAELLTPGHPRVDWRVTRHGFEGSSYLLYWTSLLQYALCMNLFNKRSRIADRGKYISSFLCSIFVHSNGNSCLIVELKIILVSVHLLNIPVWAVDRIFCVEVYIPVCIIDKALY